MLTWSCITLLDEWGIRERLSGYAPNQFIQKAIVCTFCFANHLCTLFILVRMAYGFEFYLLFIPIFVATLVNKVYEP